MPPPSGPPSSTEKPADSLSLDQVFLWLSDQVEKKGGSPTTSPIVPSGPTPVPVVAAGRGQPGPRPGAAGNPSTLSAVGSAEQNWLRQERERFEAFVASQLEALQRQRQELANGQAQVEARLISREQELNRRQAALAGWMDALQQREDGCKVKETALATRADELSTLDKQREALAADCCRLAEEVADQQRLLEEARAETNRLEGAMVGAREEYAAFEESLRQLAEEEGRRAQQRDQLEARFHALEQDELALQRRLEEVEQLEEKLRVEVEEDLTVERKKLATQKADLDAQRKNLAALEHETEARIRVEVESALTAQRQELATEREELAAQKKILCDRASAELEPALAAVREKLAAQEKKWARHEEFRERLERELAAQQRLLEQAREETARWEAAAAEARTQHATVQEALGKQTEEQARWAGECDELESRRAALKAAESNLERRQAEVEQLAEKTHADMEQGLAAQRQKLADQEKKWVRHEEYRHRLQNELADQQRFLEEMRAETERMRASLEEAKAEHAIAKESLEQERGEWDFAHREQDFKASDAPRPMDPGVPAPQQ